MRLKQYGILTCPDNLNTHKVIGYLYNQPSNVLVLQNQECEPIYATPKYQIKTVAGLVELAKAGLGLINAPVESMQIQRLLKQAKLSPVLQACWWKDTDVFAYYHPSNPIQEKGVFRLLFS